MSDREQRIDPERHAELIELADREVEGVLEPAERRRLEQALDRDPGLRREHEQLIGLQRLLHTAHVEVDPAFTDRVMAAVAAERPAVARPLPWFLLAAALLSAAVLGIWGAVGDAGGLAPVAAVADFFATTALAGAGLLAASWQGVGSVVGEWLRASVLNVVLLVGLVIGLNLLLLSMVVRRRAARASARSRD